MTKIASPSGIDLAPEPPSAVRISKRAGLVVLLVLAAVVALILLGMYARQRRQMELNTRSVEEQKPIAAVPAEKELVSEIAPAITAASQMRMNGNARRFSKTVESEVAGRFGLISSLAFLIKIKVIKRLASGFRDDT